jgi:hypothetical protein
MTTPTHFLRRLAGVALLVGLPVSAYGQQDTLARVKDFYAAASYEEALQALEQVRPSGPLLSVTDAAAYQVFCLVALGRDQAATEAIAAIVRVDPLYHPPEGEVSPRIQTFFETVRRPLLPGLVRQIYAAAKDSLDRKQHGDAKTGFDRVIALLDEMGTSEDQDLADLKTLAAGFRDLAAMAIAAAAPPPPPPPVVERVAMPEPEPVVPPPPPPPVVYSPANTDVLRPVAVSRALPPWRSVSAVDRLQTHRGEIELLIDEQGRVKAASIAESVRPDYDPILLKAARSWTFRPATKNGVPVQYLYVMEIQLRGAP